MEEIELKGSKKYKGSIGWFKLRLKGGRCKVEKRRPFGNDSYTISQAEWDWIKTPKQAEHLWAWYHFGINGKLIHPLSGKTFHQEWKEENERPTPELDMQDNIKASGL